MLSRHPQHAGAQHLLGLALLIQLRPREAVGPLAEAARATVDPRLETHYALALRDVGRKNEAIDWLKRATSRKPVFAPAFHELGLIFCGMRRYGDAEVVLKQGIALAPDHVRALHGCGTAFLFEGEFERAAAQFRQVIARNPEHLRARLDLAHCLLELGRFEAGVAELRIVVRCSPQRYGTALKILASSRRGRLWLRPSMAAAFLQIIDNVPYATWLS